MLRMLVCSSLVWLAVPMALAEETEVEAMFNAAVAPLAEETQTPVIELPITKSLGLDDEDEWSGVLSPGSSWHGFKIAN